MNNKLPHYRTVYFASLLLLSLSAKLSAQSSDYTIESLKLDGEAKQDGGALQFIARLWPPFQPTQPPLVYTLSMESQVNLTATGLVQSTQFHGHIKSGKLEAIELNLHGAADIQSVSGDGIASWSERRRSQDEQRQLVITLDTPAADNGALTFTVTAEQRWDALPVDAQPLAYNLEDAALLHGQIHVTPDSNVRIDHWEAPGLLTINAGDDQPADNPSFATDGKDYSLSLKLLPPITAPTRFEDFQLVGAWQANSLSFTLTGEIMVENPRGADLMLIDQNAAFLVLPDPEGGRIEFRNGAYRFVCDQAGRYPIKGVFVTRVHTLNGRERVHFGLANSAMRPLRLEGFPESIRSLILQHSSLRTVDNAYEGFLPPSGMLELSWADPAWKTVNDEGKLFYAAESQIETTVGVGILRQKQSIELSILQGGMREVTLWLSGKGDITRLTGQTVTNWKVGAPDPEQDGMRPVAISFNRQEKTRTKIEIELQSALGEFPVTLLPPRITANDAIRASGYWSLRNAGAVELSVRSRTHLAQIAPEFLPSKQPSDAKQLLAYRFTGNDYQLELHADNIMPEIAVSQILLYQLGENEQSINAELECDIRRAPIRDFHFALPPGYTVSRVEAPALADYFITGEDNPRLRLLFSEPIEGKRIIRLRLERNEQLPQGEWAMPYLAPEGVKSVRGHIGVTAGPGLRLGAAQLEGLAEQVTTYFPQRIDDLRLALRLRQPDWSATLTITQLSQSVQAESFHLITLAEGVLYGSTIINYAIGDAPVDAIRIRLPASYQNINFSGPNIRSWKELEDGIHQVELQRAQTGAYTLLATYEHAFTPQGARLDFGQVTPLEVESEQGYIVVTSDFPFGISGIEQSAGLISLEPNEIPSEFRLLFESQVLTAYQYTRRPLTLSMDVAPFQQGRTVNQVVDYSELTTRISGDGELLTMAVYQLKSKGHPYFRLTLPQGSKLWSVTVLDQKVTPAADGEAILVPLPAGRAADAPVPIRLQWAGRADQSHHPVLQTPRLDSPALLVNWTVNADPGFGLRYEGGNLRPSQETPVLGAWGKLRERLFGNGWGPKLVLALSLLAVAGGMIGLARARQCPRPRIVRVGAMLCLLGGILVGGALLLSDMTATAPANSLQFTTPLEQSSTDLTIKLSNKPVDAVGDFFPGWIGLVLGVGLITFGWLRQLPGGAHRLVELPGWLLVLWGTLNLGHSPAIFGLVVLAVMARYLYVPARNPQAATAMLALMLLGLFDPSPARALPIEPTEFGPVAEDLTQTITLSGQFAVVEGVMIWEAKAGETMPFLQETILQSVNLPQGLTLLPNAHDPQGIELRADEDGRHEVSFVYRVKIRTNDGVHTLTLPLAAALVNRCELNLLTTNNTVECSGAVQVEPLDDQGQQWKLLLRPAQKTEISWSRKQRDASEEEVIFFAESYDVYQPLPGIVEGAHQLTVRPSQGVIEQLSVQTPVGLTITSVTAPNLELWRFDPERRVVDLYFQPGHTGEWTATLRSQYTSQVLPYQQVVEPLTVINASDQISLIALATNNEVQIGEVDREQVSAINLEDFPEAALSPLVQPGNQPAVRRAFRWAGTDSRLAFQAEAVLPDIRVSSNDRLSYGEDRTLLSSQLEIEVTRAGIFELSFAAPTDFDIESISGTALSHWNENQLPGGERLVTLQLKQKLLGATSFSLTLSGPGLAAQTTTAAPRILPREASRQTGVVAILPELGYRLSATDRQAVSQLDPKEFGLHDPRAQLYRYLNEKGQVVFKVDVVPPWIEVNQHQSVTIRSGMMDSRVRIEFLVENAGVRELLVQVPTDSLGVRFTGEALDRFEAVEGKPGQWRLHLDRKRIGKFILEAEYQRPTPQQPQSETIRGFQALGANQTTGALSLSTVGRLELTIPTIPDSLQRGESQMIPPALRFEKTELGVARVFRVLNADFQLPVKLIHRDSAKTLPAQVKNAQLTTVIADSGAALTRMQIELDPGDKRLLRLQLPRDSTFWYAFINSQSTWPWLEGEELILQLESIPANAQATVVEFYYSTQLPVSGRHLNEQLTGPRIDLPMESIAWKVFYPESWNIQQWSGNLTKEENKPATRSTWLDLASYATASTESARKKTDQAKIRLAEGNQLLATGQQFAAREAFEDAYFLSENDADFNEDARVQLQTLREQQALVGLAQRRNLWNASKGSQQAELNNVDVMQFRQQEAQQILQANTVEDNAALREVAREVLQQQQAALARPQALMTNLPEQGKTANFVRSLQVDDQAGLYLHLSGTRQVSSHFWENLALLALIAMFLAVIGGINRLLVSRSDKGIG